MITAMVPYRRLEPIKTIKVTRLWTLLYTYAYLSFLDTFVYICTRGHSSEKDFLACLKLPKYFVSQTLNLNIQLIN